jgi:hypothetical protein
MPKYEVTAIMFLTEDRTDCITVKETGIHPDIVKQSLYKKYPKREMKGISILDVTPLKTYWTSL